MARRIWKRGKLWKSSVHASKFDFDTKSVKRTSRRKRRHAMRAAVVGAKYDELSTMEIQPRSMAFIML